MGVLAKFASLPRCERALVVKAVIALVATEAGLRFLPFTTVRRFARHSYASRASRMQMPRHSAQKISWAIESSSRRIPGAMNCLVRALATEYLLGHFGYSAELRIGVARTAAGAITAHAWLESEGAVIIGEFELDRYVVFAVSNAGKA